MSSTNERGQNAEEDFFRREDARLMEQLRAVQSAESARDVLAKAIGISSPAVLDLFTQLKISAETAAALSVLPFVEVAWADGTIDAKERAALTELAKSKGFKPGTKEFALLELWLDKRPAPRMFEAWTHTIHGMCEKLKPAEVAQLRKTVIERARSVANISGGVLGIGKVSAAESAMLTKLEKVFDRG
jgi:tellurite resistance protein